MPTGLTNTGPLPHDLPTPVASFTLSVAAFAVSCINKYAFQGECRFQSVHPSALTSGHCRPAECMASACRARPFLTDCVTVTRLSRHTSFEWQLKLQPRGKAAVADNCNCKARQRDGAWMGRGGGRRGCRLGAVEGGRGLGLDLPRQTIRLAFRFLHGSLRLALRHHSWVE